MHHLDSENFLKRNNNIIKSETRPTKLAWTSTWSATWTRNRPLCQRKLKSASCSATHVSTPSATQYMNDSSWSSASSTSSKQLSRNTFKWPTSKSNALRSDAMAMKRSFNPSVLSM